MLSDVPCLGEALDLVETKTTKNLFEGCSSYLVTGFERETVGWEARILPQCRAVP